MIDDEDEEQLELFDAPAPPKKRQVNAKMRRDTPDLDPEVFARKLEIRHRRQRFIRWLRQTTHRCASCGGRLDVDGRRLSLGIELRDSLFGPEVVSIAPPSDAAGAGLQPGDVLTSIRGTRKRPEEREERETFPRRALTSSADFSRAVGAVGTFHRIRIGYTRAGQHAEAKASLSKTCARCLAVDSKYKDESVVVKARAIYRDELGRPMALRFTPRMLPVYGPRYDGSEKGWPECEHLSACQLELIKACAPKDAPGMSCPKDCASRAASSG